MTDIKPRGSSESSIRVNVDVEAAAEGRSRIHHQDGTISDGPPHNRFVRFVFDTIEEGDWLINPATNETHKVMEKLIPSSSIVISISGPELIQILTIDEATEGLLKVVGE